MKKYVFAVLALLIAAPLYGQQVIGGLCINPSGAWIPISAIISGPVYGAAQTYGILGQKGSSWYGIACDASGNITAGSLPQNATDPATCTTGQVEFNTTSNVPKYCYPANTWNSWAGGSGTFNALTGDATSTATGGATTVKGLNGTLLSSLASCILYNTTSTGVPSCAVAANVTALFSGTCSASTYLRGDGSCATPSGSGATIQVNGVNTSNQALLNFETSTANTVGLTVTPSNPSGGIVKLEVTGVPIGAACQTYTGNNSTVTINLSLAPCFVVTGTNAVTIALSNPNSSSGLWDVTLKNGATAAAWTLPASALGFGLPAPVASAQYTNPSIYYDGTSYWGPFSNETPSILRFTSTRAAPTQSSCSGGTTNNSGGGCFWIDSTDNDPEWYLNTSAAPFKMFQSGGDANPVTGVVTGINGATLPASATVLATNGSKQVIAATYQGNGAKAQLSTGSTTTNDCVKFDANGNTVDAGGACGSGGGSGGTALNPECTFSASATSCTITVSGLSVPNANYNSIIAQCWTGGSTTQTAVTITSYAYVTGATYISTVAPSFLSAAAAGYCTANLTSGGINSATGTANQIDVTAGSAPTFSLDSAINFPGNTALSSSGGQKHTVTGPSTTGINQFINYPFAPLHVASDTVTSAASGNFAFASCSTTSGDSCTIPANSLVLNADSTPKKLRLSINLTFVNGSAQSTENFFVQLCTVNGCGSGTVKTIYQSDATGSGLAGPGALSGSSSVVLSLDCYGIAAASGSPSSNNVVCGTELARMANWGQYVSGEIEIPTNAAIYVGISGTWYSAGTGTNTITVDTVDARWD